MLDLFIATRRRARRRRQSGTLHWFDPSTAHQLQVRAVDAALWRTRMRRALVLFPSRPSTRPGSGASGGTRRAPRRAAPALLAVREATEVVAVAKSGPRGTPKNAH